MGASPPMSAEISAISDTPCRHGRSQNGGQIQLGDPGHDASYQQGIERHTHKHEDTGPQNVLHLPQLVAGDPLADETAGDSLHHNFGLWGKFPYPGQQIKDSAENDRADHGSRRYFHLIKEIAPKHSGNRRQQYIQYQSSAPRASPLVTAL